MNIYRAMADSGGCSLLEVHGRLIYRNSHDKFQSSSFGAEITTGTHTACLHGISTPRVVNKDGRLICLDCATRGPWRELPTFSHFLRYSGRKCKVGENAVLGLSKPELVRNACFYVELVSVTYAQTIHSNQRKKQSISKPVIFSAKLWPPKSSY